MKDLTKGRPSVLILTFALPIFLANLLQLTYSLADTRIVGTFLGDNALAAVGATTTLSNLIVQFLMGMCNGFAIISAQCFGAKDMDRLRRSLGNSLVLGLLAAVVLTIGGLVFLQPILRFLNVPENLLNTATQYVSVIIAGLVVTLLYDVLAATLRAIGDTVTPLIVLAVSVVLNIGGDLLLIVVLHMGDADAGLSPVFEALEKSMIPIKIFRPTHVNRRKGLLEEGYQLLEKGGYIDLTCGISEDFCPGGCILEAKEKGIPTEHITISSDGHGSWSKYREDGSLLEIGVSSVDALREEFLYMVHELDMKLEDALPYMTSHVAEALGLQGKKGTIQKGADADLLLWDNDLKLDSYIAGGKIFMQKEKIICKGTYEK